jgi:hypothetical protein
MYCTSKIVVFDLDETLGYYVEFGMFWDALKNYIKMQNISVKVDQLLFNKVLDLYPEFSRPNIVNILNFLKQKKRVKHCHKLMIYTNNQGPDEWAQQIQAYFETKLNYKLFDQIIKAFKIRGKHVELCRTSHMKNHKDLISCTKIPETTEICFLDDVFHPGMVDDRIYYINVKPYVHDLPFEVMIDRFINSGILKEIENENNKNNKNNDNNNENNKNNDNNNENNKNNDNNNDKPIITEFTSQMLIFMKRYHHEYVEKTPEAQNVDKILSKKIMQHLHIFFNKSFNKPTQITRRNLKTGYKNLKNKNKTIKNKSKL